MADCYKKVNYLKAYEFPLEPLNGPQMWTDSPYDPIIAPPLKKLRNRPIAKRKQSVGEVDAIKLSRKGPTQKCGNCGGQGHNKRRYPNPQKVVQPRLPQPPKGAKQPQGRCISTQQPQANKPMHNRGVGVYTYENGYQRQAVVNSIIHSIF